MLSEAPGRILSNIGQIRSPDFTRTILVKFRPSALCYPEFHKTRRSTQDVGMFRAPLLSGVLCRELGCCMGRPLKETTIERIYREVNGRKMSESIKRILLPKRAATRKR